MLWLKDVKKVIEKNSISLRSEWDQSYINENNNILYPQVEVVRFLNRYVTTRNVDGSITRLIGGNSGALKCLDFACGVGTHSIVLNDFGVEAYGIDISKAAIEIAKANAKRVGLTDLVDRFSVIDNDEQNLSFGDQYFDFVIAESCLDSMPFEVARRYFLELKRVCKKYIYISLIASESSPSNQDEVVVQTAHEKGTIQSYFDLLKLEKLIGVPVETLSHIELLKHANPISNEVKASRYFCVVDLGA